MCRNLIRALAFLLLSIPLLSSAADKRACLFAMGGKPAAPLNADLSIYETARTTTLPAKGRELPLDHGWRVVERDAQGAATKARLDILVDNPGYAGQLFIVGPFNDWGGKLRESDRLVPHGSKPYIFTATVEGLKQGMPYRLLLNGKQVIDPSATMYSTPEYLEREGQLKNGSYLNSIFWDAKDPRFYQSKTTFVDNSDRPQLIGEVELHSLVAKFRARDGQVGPRQVADTYRFIAESGVIERLRDAGYTAVEMLPFNQSIDGHSWHLRYQVYGNFAPDSRYGNPSEFKQMIDEFHKFGIAVIMDTVVSHFPYKGNQGVRELAGVGLDQWHKVDGRKLYVGPLSPWDTYRYDYANPYLRKFLIDGVVFMMTEYKVDGVRVDNVDGILGTDGGSVLLKDLTAAIRAVNPKALLIGEAFYPPSSLLHRIDRGGYGFDTRNDSNVFEIWKEGLQGPTEHLKVGSLGSFLRKVFEWGEAPMMRYLSNHDESANGRGGLTGSYPATLIGGDEYYSFSKVKAADGFNMVAGAFHLSFPQARMMQRGSFYNNPAIDWSLTEHGRGKQLWDYFGALGRYIQYRGSYFNFRSLTRDVENHVDDVNKIISLKRRDPDTGKKLYVLINLGHRRIENYAFGVHKGGAYRVGFDSEWQGFGGAGELGSRLNGSQLHARQPGEHGQEHSLLVPVVAPYSVTILEEI